jgi:hypothetical protein
MGFWFLKDGERLPVTNMFAWDGEKMVKTDNPEEALSLVARMPNGKWLATQCFDGEIIKDGGH